MFIKMFDLLPPHGPNSSHTKPAPIPPALLLGLRPSVSVLLAPLPAARPSVPQLAPGLCLVWT